MPGLQRLNQNSGTATDSAPISDELVRRLADRVYAMLITELVIERERQRLSNHANRFGGQPFPRRRSSNAQR